MSRRRKRQWTDLTVTDQFCGAGGSTEGAKAAGVRVRQAMNHWKLATETYNTNHPDTDVDCADVSASDPRRYASTDILITSPECTTHSPAGGTRRSKPQRDFFQVGEHDASTARSRATAWDVCRFAEYHQYEIIVTENVYEFTRWMLFPEWLAAMAKLGYSYRIVSLNSLFTYPTPQTRDRVYTVFWRKGNRAPQLDHQAPAPCPRCEKVVQAVQAWKPQRTMGKYRQQYEYHCPACRLEVRPFYFAALNAIDLSIAGERIGDRPRPLKTRTLERIEYGRQKFGRTALVIRTNMTTDHGRVSSVLDPARTQVAQALDAVATPCYLVDTAQSSQLEPSKVRGVGEPHAAQTTSQSSALISLPYLVSAGSNPTRARAADRPAPAMTGTERHAVVTPTPVLVDTVHDGPPNPRVRAADEGLSTVEARDLKQGVMVPPAGVVTMRTHSVGKDLGHPLQAVNTGGHHMLVAGSALISLRGGESNLAYLLSAGLPTQIANGAQQWTLSPQPFLVSYYGTDNVSGAGAPCPTVTCLDRHALLDADAELPPIEDYYFRMLQPHEIGRAMAFPDRYVVLGTKRDQVKQFGNAVTPPAMDWLIRRCIASLHPEFQEAA